MASNFADIPVLPDSFHSTELRRTALSLLSECGVRQKAAGVQRLAKAWTASKFILDTDTVLVAPLSIPGIPEKPELVSPLKVRRRAMNTSEGRAAMVHAMVHIEFNAINLALDAIWRFPNLPREYYVGWLQVADEEALHFDLLSAHLGKLGYAYGDFPAHSGLWDLAQETQHDVLARMALLPRTMEAHGLDVTPGLKAKLVQAGDTEGGAIMDIILCDEVGHVAIGNHWFHWLCEQRGLDAIEIYRQLATAYDAPAPRGPFNLAARRAAGFSELELRALEAGVSAG